MNERLIWDEIQKKYPDQWVIVTDAELSKENFIKSGIILKLCTDSDIEDAVIDYCKRGIPIEYQKTFKESELSTIDFDKLNLDIENGITLSLSKIIQRYPNQCLGLANIKYQPNSKIIDTATVVYTDKTFEELSTLKLLTNGKIINYFTTPDNEIELLNLEVV